MTAARLYLSQTIDVALDDAASCIAADKQEDPLAPADLLLPTLDSAAYARQRLGDTVGVQFHVFPTLARAILLGAGKATRELNGVALRRLVRRLLEEMMGGGELTTFAAVYDKPGFGQVLLEWLREMKGQEISPEQVEALAGGESAEDSRNERDRQLATFYRRYQLFLAENDFADAEGMLWLAAEALEANPHRLRQTAPLYVLGFDQFTPVQLHLLAQLARQTPQPPDSPAPVAQDRRPLTFYLAWDARLPDSGLALTRLRQTRKAIDQALAPEVRLLEDTSTTAPALKHLRHTLFESDVREFMDSASEALGAVAAPSREDEVRIALRAVKRLLLEGSSPEQIALLAPHPAAYRRLVQTVAAEYGTPLRLEQSLGSNPAVSALSNLLGLAPEFAWRPVFDALRSPYIDQTWLSPEQIDLLDRLTRERPVVAGREQWQFALQPLQLEDVGVDDEDLSGRPLVASLDHKELSAIETGLLAFFDHLTPGSVELRDYVLWVQEALLGLSGYEAGKSEAVLGRPSLDMLARCGLGEWAGRDLAALGQVLKIMRQLVEAADLVPASMDDDLSWVDYRRDVLRAIQAAMMPQPTTTEGGQAVHFGPMKDGRAVAVDNLFIFGLAEGEFPKTAVPDPIYAPSEREAQLLPLQSVDPAEDASLLWQVIANCRRRLVLFRPRLDENGAPWLPSPYWSAVLEKFNNTEVMRPPVGALPEPEEAASPAELLAALARSGAATIPPELAEPWRSARLAGEVQRQRNGWGPLGVYEGVFQATDLVEALSVDYGPGHHWSPSRLNKYGNCPFGYFAEEILQLAPRPDPEEGLDALQRGSLLHAVLERLHSELAGSGIALTVPNRESALLRLEASCDAIFPLAPQRYGFRPGPLWRYERRELRRLLRSLVVWECEENGSEGRFSPFRQEVRFGILGASAAYLSLTGRDGTLFQLQGIIDRLDLDESGAGRVIDYKSGSSAFSKSDIQRGYALQTALYALAAERLLPEVAQVAESFFLHIPTRQASGQLLLEQRPADREIVDAAVEQAAWFVYLVRSGAFASTPAKAVAGGTACRSGCQFAALCRVTRQSIAKGRSQYGR